MDLRNLQEDVKRLMYVEEIDDYDAFLYATNRAIYRTRSVFPKIKREKLAVYPLENLLNESAERVREIKGKEMFFANDVCSYYFEAEGEGSADFYYFNADKSVRDYELLFSVEINSHGAFKSYKGFVKRFGSFELGKFKVVFGGNYLIRVKNLALYDTLLSVNEEDIPAFSDKVEIDLETATKSVVTEMGEKKIKSDFMGLRSPVKQLYQNREMEVSYELTDKKLFVKRKYIGEVIIYYIALPDTVGVSSKMTDEVDFPQELAPFAAYLVASNLMIEEENELSSQYLSRYIEAEAYAKALSSIKCGMYEYTGDVF